MHTLITLVAIVAVFFVRVISAIAIHHFPSIYYDHSYHIYYGALLFIIGIAIRKKFTLKQILAGAGLGLMVDDLPVLRTFFFQTGDPITEYWGPMYVIPMVAGLLIICLTENQLNAFLKKR